MPSTSSGPLHSGPLSSTHCRPQRLQTLSIDWPSSIVEARNKVNFDRYIVNSSSPEALLGVFELSFCAELSPRATWAAWVSLETCIVCGTFELFSDCILYEFWKTVSRLTTKAKSGRVWGPCSSSTRQFDSNARFGHSYRLVE